MAEPSLDHSVFDLRHEPGELSFDARIGDHRERVWLRTDPDRPTSPEAVLPACLMPAMRFGGTLELPMPISPRLLRDQIEYQGIQRAWSLDSEHLADPLREVNLLAPGADVEPTSGNGRVAALFSAGVDSWSTLLDHPEVTDLIFVRGLDLLLDVPHQAALIGEVERRIRRVAEELELSLHVVHTNLRALTDPIIPWETVYGSVKAAIALFLTPRFERVLIANGFDYEVYQPEGVSGLVDQLWSNRGAGNRPGRWPPHQGRANRADSLLSAGSEHPQGVLGESGRRLQLRPLPQVPADDADAGGAGNSRRRRHLPGRARPRRGGGDPDLEAPRPPALGRRPRRGAGRGQGGPRAGGRSGRRRRQAAAGAPRRLPAPQSAGAATDESLGRPAVPRHVPIEVLDAEARETLRTVLDSRSWKLTAPLRRLGSRLQGRA